MHSMIAGPIVIVSAMLLAACADPIGPGRNTLGNPTVVATLARGRPGAPVPVPDSVGIPPSIPPIHEEVPEGFDAQQ